MDRALVIAEDVDRALDPPAAVEVEDKGEDGFDRHAFGSRVVDERRGRPQLESVLGSRCSWPLKLVEEPFPGDR